MFDAIAQKRNPISGLRTADNKNHPNPLRPLDDAYAPTAIEKTIQKKKISISSPKITGGHLAVRVD